MGTSSARRAPTTRLWRLAKVAATRYLSPESAGAVEAREVAARYVAALGKGGGPGPAGALAAFRLTRRVAQNLGAFCCRVNSHGWPAALNDWGLKALADDESGAWAHSLSTALGTPDGGLEQAVTHTALVGLWLDWSPAPGPLAEVASSVRRFLVQAFHLRLALDLGESLEAAAASLPLNRQGLEELAAWIDQAAPASLTSAAPSTPEDWQGLPGWTWVTNLLAGLITRLADPNGP